MGAIFSAVVPVSTTALAVSVLLTVSSFKFGSHTGPAIRLFVTKFAASEAFQILVGIQLAFGCPMSWFVAFETQITLFRPSKPVFNRRFDYYAIPMILFVVH